MEMNEAVAIAKKEANCVFKDEHLLNLSLEEAVHEGSEPQGQWLVTLSFGRHIKDGTIGGTLTNMSGGRITFKTFVVRESDKKVISVKSRTSS